MLRKTNKTKTNQEKTNKTIVKYLIGVCERDQLGVYGLAEARKPKKPKKSNFLKHYEKYGHGPQWARKPKNPKWATRR